MPPKSVLITGCSAGGIGDELAQAFHRHGCRVFATARNLAKVEHLKHMGMTVLPLDVTDGESLKKAVESVKAATDGTLDLLVNNSGAAYSLPLLDANLEEMKKLFDTNLFGLIATTQAFAPLLIAAKGTLVNIGSVVGYFNIPWQGVYNASKAAVNSVTDTLRAELEPLGVKVVLVITGGITTKIFENQTDKHLPKTSAYLAAEDVMIPYMTGEKYKDQSVAARPYAESVVRNALKARPQKHQWAGGNSSLIWAVSTFLWSTAWDLVIPRVCGVAAVKERLLSQKKNA